MTIWSLIIFLFTGLVAGWIASEAVRAKSLGLAGNIIVGIIGSLIAGLWLPHFGFHWGPVLLMHIVNAAIGGIVLLVIVAGLQRIFGK